MPNTENIDHDSLFKELLRLFFYEFIEFFLPDLAEKMLRDDIIFLEKELFQLLDQGESKEVDILVKAKMRDTDALFLIHLEQQSKKQSYFPQRFFFYFARLHEKFSLPIFPIALFSYDKPQKADSDHYSVVINGFEVLSFQYKVVQLNRLNWRNVLRQIQDRNNPAAIALLSKMNVAEEDRPQVRLECLRALARLHIDSVKTAFLWHFIKTYLPLNEVQEQEFATAVETENQNNTIMVRELSWYLENNEWYIDGKQKGIEQGIEQERIHLIMKMLRRKFGATSVSVYEERIAALPSESLLELAEEMLFFDAIQDLANWLLSQDKAAY